MAFDGVTIANIVSELKKELVGGRLYKIAQPEEDELLLTVKQPGGQKRLLLSADASLPLIYLTENNKPSPMTAPSFCMLLRKHLQNGRITDISQPGLERIVHIRIEHLDEMGDLRSKTLVIEIMGKHSNIIFCSEDGIIIDSIKRVSAAVSSLREVLPGKPYFVAETQNKLDALSTDCAAFREALSAKPQPLFKALYGSFTGISPILAQELCHRGGADAELPAAALDEAAWQTLYNAFAEMTDAIRKEHFVPNIAYTAGKPVEFCALPLTLYGWQPDAPDQRRENPPATAPSPGIPCPPCWKTTMPKGAPSPASARSPPTCAASSRPPWSATSKNMTCSCGRSRIPKNGIPTGSTASC